ncbi:hypothetical protein M2480_001468 [Parabacteroides sp. PFB2-12]|nr:hypothetical protein [Parabacteroides sp. PM6-13]MDH6390493.1 hypothetical protein [Parabacteroides sp. PFB2-12]
MQTNTNVLIYFRYYNKDGLLPLNPNGGEHKMRKESFFKNTWVELNNRSRLAELFFYSRSLKFLLTKMIERMKLTTSTPPQQAI